MRSKKEIVIPIKGLNHRDKGVNIDEGSCEKIHNVSYRYGAWRSVKQFAVETVVDKNSISNSKYSVIYVHPALPSNEYLASYINLPYSYNIYHIKLVDGIFIEQKLLATFSSFLTDSLVNISHYGNMLMISENIDNFSFCLLYENGEYKEANYDSLLPIRKMTISYDSKIPVYSPSSMIAPLVATVKTKTQNIGSSVYTLVDSINKNYQDIYSYFSQKSLICGTANIFFAYKLEDGSIVKVGDVFMINPQEEKCSISENLYHQQSGDMHYYYMMLWAYKFSINFYSENILPAGVLPYVKSIVIYSSPIIPQYDFDNIYDEYKNSDSLMDYKNHCSVVYDYKNANILYDKRNNDVLQRPFYKIAEHDFRKGINMIDIDAKNYENIETKPIYIPTFSQYIATSKTLNFNGRFHRYAPKINFFKGGVPLVKKYSKVLSGVSYSRKNESNRYFKYFYYLKINGKQHVVMSSEKSFYYVLSGDVNNPNARRYVMLPNFVGYPDMRAYRLVIALSEEQSRDAKIHILKDIKLTSAPANNFAYFQDCSQNRVVGFYLIDRLNVSFNINPPERVNDLASLPNVMMVSTRGNPFTFDFKNIYTYGQDETKIIDITLPVDDFSDISYGNYPLYIFTSAGIYAIQKGTGDKEYGSSVLVNTDCILRDDVSVLNGRIFYVTKRGVMCLSGRNSKNISDVLVGENIYYDESFLDYLKNSRLVALTQYNELLLYNTLERANSYAYLFSIEGGVWSTRTFSGSSVCGKLFVDGVNIYNSNKYEEGSLLSSEIYLNDTLFDNFRKKKIEMLNFDSKGNYGVSVNGLEGNVDVPLKIDQNIIKMYRLLRSWERFKIKFWGIFDSVSKIKIIFTEKYCK